MTATKAGHGLRMETGGIGGQTLWGPLPDTRDYYLLWPGVGSRLYLAIRPTSPDGLMTTVDHPSADASYMTRKDADAAVARFMAAQEG
jgi:hypothetical protein